MHVENVFRQLKNYDINIKYYKILKDILDTNLNDTNIL